MHLFSSKFCYQDFGLPQGSVWFAISARHVVASPSFGLSTCLWLACLVALCTLSGVANGREAVFAGWPVFHTVVYRHYDGVTDDLLTAGLGRHGLAHSIPPSTTSNPPTAAELRRLAIYNFYRALIDTSAGGGYGTVLGPNVTSKSEITDDPGLIVGEEILAFMHDHHGQNITLLVQVPEAFDTTQPCLAAVAVPGSCGIYCGIAGGGELALKRGCAVVYTDKGAGTGAHYLQDNTVNLLRGERANADQAGSTSNFTAPLSVRQRADFNAAKPYRFAFKHAHSRQNPERNWGNHVLQAIKFGFAALNWLSKQRNWPAFSPENTTVIALGLSNGGGAALRAGEQDRGRLIDGIVVAEPNVNPRFDGSFVIVQGNKPAISRHSRPLYDYVTLLNLYQGCANRDPAQAAAPLNVLNFPDIGASRCQGLNDYGLLSETDLVEQAAEAQALINASGLLPEQNIIQPAHWYLSVPQALGVTYANAYARRPVQASLCGYSFAAVDPLSGEPTPIGPAIEATLFATSGGIPPTAGIELINDDALGNPRENRRPVSSSTGRQDENLDGALCLRALWTGIDFSTGHPLTGPARAWHRRLRKSVWKIQARGNLGGIPTVIVTGRNDAVLPPNHTSRAYHGLNQRQQENDSPLRYYEVKNAQHFDAFNALPGFDQRFIPLQFYYQQAFQRLLSHLLADEPLPPSQVVHTQPRGLSPDGSVPPLDPEAHLSPLSGSPPPEALIRFTGNTLHIPE